MRVEKKVMDILKKCYSIAPLRYRGENHILVAAEKNDPCKLFDLDGNYKETIWEEPGGTMSMVQVPESDGVFLATHQFYSPNDSKEAKIVRVSPEKGGWKVDVLVELPFVHRFDIVSRNGVYYLIACTLKSGHDYKDDWNHPGKVYACVLPKDLSVYSKEHQLPMEVVMDGMTKNHGYYKVKRDGHDIAVVSCEEGVYCFSPPQEKNGNWEIEKLIDDSSSDAVLLDLDGDGQEELVTIAPFHGDNIYIYHKDNGMFKKVYEYENKAQFAHAIFGGELCGHPSVIIGHRKGEKALLAIFWDREKNRFESEHLDEGCGAANVFHYIKDGVDVVVSTNREIDEIAMYRIYEGEEI